MRLVARHGGRRGAIGEQLELLADAVLGLAARAVEVLVEHARVEMAALERGEDEPRMAPSRLCSALPTTPLAAPAVEGRIAEITKYAHRGAGRQMPALGFGHFVREFPLQAGVARQPEHVIDPIGLAHAISSSLAKPESARNTMRTFGHFRRICPTMRAISSTAPATPEAALMRNAVLGAPARHSPGLQVGRNLAPSHPHDLTATPASQRSRRRKIEVRSCR
jgi:hypothetical protein